MLRKIVLLNLFVMSSVTPVLATNNSNLDPLSISAQRLNQVSQTAQWDNAPMVSLTDQKLKSHPVIRQLMPGISLANDLSYAVGKHHLATHHKNNQNGTINLKEIEDEIALHNKNAALILKELNALGWTPGIHSADSTSSWSEQLANSLIKGKSGSIESEIIDNISGLILFHKETGTLLPVFHGSRGGDHDWSANLDAHPTEIDFCGKKITAHRGFVNTALSLKESLHERLMAAYKVLGNQVRRTLHTGHSHGAAISSLACMNAVAELGPALKGAGFNNVKESFFCHMGISEPASLQVDSLEHVRNIVGADNFLSPGAQHDPVVQLLRAEFWNDFDSVVNGYITGDRDKQKAANLVLEMLSGFMPSPKWKNIMVMMSNPEMRLKYTQVGHLALEPYKELLGRMTVNFLNTRSIDLQAIVGVVHYGGVGGNFDRRLPAALNLVRETTPYLDTMLQVAKEDRMTISRMISDITSIKSYITKGEFIGDAANALIENAKDSPAAATAVVAGAAGLTAYGITMDSTEKYQRGEIGGWNYALRMLGALAFGSASGYLTVKAIDQAKNSDTSSEQEK